jgi:hypothetical protein
MTYIPDSQVDNCADDLLTAFAEGPLHSQSSINQILPHAYVAMADHGLPARRSLAIVIAKRAQAAWQGEIMRVQRIAHP